MTLIFDWSMLRRLNTGTRVVISLPQRPKRCGRILVENARRKGSSQTRRPISKGWNLTKVSRSTSSDRKTFWLKRSTRRARGRGSRQGGTGKAPLFRRDVASRSGGGAGYFSSDGRSLLGLRKNASVLRAVERGDERLIADFFASLMHTARIISHCLMRTESKRWSKN